jgi:hypothetical protein
MSAETAIIAALRAASGVTTLVGASTVARIYALFAPNNATLPYIVVQQISGNRDYTHDGLSGRVTSRWQITCVDDQASGVRSLANAVRAALPAAGGTYDSTVLQTIFLEDEGDIPVVEADSGTPIYGKRLDYSIAFEE